MLHVSLVLSIDAPISYIYPKHNDVIRELIRIAKKALVICVSSRLGGYPSQFTPALKKPFLVDENDPDRAVRWYVHEWTQRDSWKPNFERADRLWDCGLLADPDTVYEKMKDGGTPWPVTYFFHPEEISELFRKADLSEVRLAGPGALARTLPGDILRILL